jgi:hypothetical protein
MTNLILVIATIFKNRWMLVALLITLLPFSAQAKIGETRAQIIKRFGRAAMISGDEYTLRFENKNYALVSFVNGRSVMEIYWVGTRYSVADATEILNTVLGGDRWKWTTEGNCMRTTNGLYEAKISPTTGDGPYRWAIAVGYTKVVEAMVVSSATQKSSPTPAPAPETTPNDCLIVATEAFARLSKSAAWARIAGFKIWEAGKASAGIGHAVVFYQPTQASNVWLYDSNGSHDMGTQSHELATLITALNRSLKVNYAVSDASWLDGYLSTDPDAGLKDAASTHPDQGLKRAQTEEEDPASTPAAMPEASKAPTSQTLLTVEQVKSAAEITVMVLVVIAVKMVIGGGIGYLIGRSKNRQWAGFWWGTCAGWIGWVIAACMRKKVADLYAP